MNARPVDRPLNQASVLGVLDKRTDVCHGSRIAALRHRQRLFLAAGSPVEHTGSGDARGDVVQVRLLGGYNVRVIPHDQLDQRRQVAPAHDRSMLELLGQRRVRGAALDQGDAHTGTVDFADG